MKKYLITFLLALLSISAFSATVTGSLTNSYNQPDTNAIKLIPLVSFPNADGSWQTAGLPKWIRPDTNGFFSMNLNAGNYILTNWTLVSQQFVGPANFGTSQGVIIAVPSDNGTYPFGLLAIPGYNVYNYNGSSAFRNTNSSSVGAGTNVTILTNANSYTVNVPTQAFLTNGQTTLVYSNPASFTTTASFTDGTNQIAAKDLANLIATNAALVAQLNATNAALIAAINSASNVLQFTKQPASGMLTNLSATGAFTNSIVAGTNVTLSTNGAVVTIQVSSQSFLTNNYGTAAYSNATAFVTTAQGVQITNGYGNIVASNASAFVTQAQGAQITNNYGNIVFSNASSFVTPVSLADATNLVVAMLRATNAIAHTDITNNFNQANVNATNLSVALSNAIAGVSSSGAIQTLNGNGTNTSLVSAKSITVTNLTIAGNNLLSSKQELSVASQSIAFGGYASTFGTGEDFMAASDNADISGTGQHRSIISSSQSGINSGANINESTIINGNNTTNFGNANDLSIGRFILNNKDGVLMFNHSYGSALSQMSPYTNDSAVFMVKNGFGINITNPAGYALNVGGSINASNMYVNGVAVLTSISAQQNTNTVGAGSHISIVTNASGNSAVYVVSADTQTNGYAGTNFIYVNFYPSNNPSSFVTKVVTNGFVDASITNGYLNSNGVVNILILTNNLILTVASNLATANTNFDLANGLNSSNNIITASNAITAAFRATNATVNLLITNSATANSNLLLFVNSTIGRNTNFLLVANAGSVLANGTNVLQSATSWTNISGSSYATNPPGSATIFVSGSPFYGSSSGYLNGPWTNINGIASAPTTIFMPRGIVGQPGIIVTNNYGIDNIAIPGIITNNETSSVQINAGFTVGGGGSITSVGGGFIGGVLLGLPNGTVTASTFNGGRFNGDGSGLTGITATNFNTFNLPFTTNQLIYPTNFWVANPALTNQVVIMHINGSTVIYSNSANTAIGRGQTLLNAEEDASLAAGDVFFLSAGRYHIDFNTLTNQGLAVAPIDLTSAGTDTYGSMMVGMGNGITILDVTNSGSAAFGAHSSMRDLTMTNCNGFADIGAPLSFATNEFAYFINVGYTNLSTSCQDVWILGSSQKQNLWIQNSHFDFNYDVFAMSTIPITNTLVSFNNTYTARGQNVFPVTRVQYGCMARIWYATGDKIYSFGGTNYNIGIDNSDSGLTNSTGYIWNDSVVVSGIGQRSINNGNPVYTNNQIFIGNGNSFDSGSAMLNFNGFSITNIQAASIQHRIIQTNFISGKVYNNSYGVAITVNGNVTETVAAVSGSSMIALRMDALPINGGWTNFQGSQTTASSIAQNYTNCMTIEVATNANFTFTNLSTGAGNSANVLGGQIRY